MDILKSQLQLYTTQKNINDGIIRLFFGYPGSSISIYNEGGNFYSAIMTLTEIKKKILFYCPGLKVITNTTILFQADMGNDKISTIKVELRFVRPTNRMDKIVGEELQNIDTKTFHKMIDMMDDADIFA